MKKQVTVRVDANISIADLARAFEVIGCELRSDTGGEVRVTKRRIRKPVERQIKAVREAS